MSPVKCCGEPSLPVYGRERQGISKLFDKLGKEELLSTEKE